VTLTAKPLVFLHPSDELYGADRMLLEMIAALPSGLPAQVWLPDDLAHPAKPLCTELTALGIHVRHLGLPILRRAYRNPRALARLAGRAARLRRELQASDPQLVYCTTSAALLGAPVARAAGVPVVVAHAQEIWSDFDRRLLTVPARACHHLLAISDAVERSLPATLRERTTVVANATPEPEVVTSLEGRSGPLQYVVASRWNGWKGHATLLAAWDRIDDGELTVLGGPPASGDVTDVVRLVAGLRRPESVTIVGEVSDPSTYLNAADIVLVPSDRPEPFGLVAIEAFARGRPVIASAGGGLLDIVTPGGDGWLFPPGDVAALAVLLATVTRTDAQARGRAARKTYEERFSTPRFAAEWRSAIEADLARARQRQHTR
jgi:glycosyltransferase involved in cell wall biosynthesis